MPRVAWITGASTGIGRAVALALADNGWLVAATARNLQRLSEVEAAGAERIRAFAADVTDPAEMKAQAVRIERELGPVELAIFNAGTHEAMPAHAFSSDVVRHLFEVNVMGVAHGIEAVLPQMMARRSGRVMVVGSLAGYSGLPTAAAYGATKAALANMAEALRPDLMMHGVALQLVSPGFVKTPLTGRNDFPMPFLISAEQAAAAILRGLNSNRFEIAFPRGFALIMKLARMLPYWLYFRITRRMVRS